jgi:homoserine trans-succinylase
MIDGWPWWANVMLVMIFWGGVAGVFAIIRKHKKLFARKIVGVYASVEAARAVLRICGFAPGYSESNELWDDKNCQNSLVVAERSDGTASVYLEKPKIG